MIDILVDTNIVIYLMDPDPEHTGFILSMGGTVRFGISAVTYMELLVGLHSEKERREFEDIIREFIIIPLDAIIAAEAAASLRERSAAFVDRKLADTIIAYTALQHRVPVFTNNPKDFSRFPGLRVLTPQREQFRKLR